MQSISCELLGWMKCKLESRLPGEISITSFTSDDTHLNGIKLRGTEEPLDEVKEESEKAGLKLNIQKTKIMASISITSWQVGGEMMETVTDFIFLVSKITADGDCKHEIKRHLLIGRKAMTKPRQHIKNQRHCFADKSP